MARRFVQFYDEKRNELCGEAFYFDQRLATRTIVETIIARCERQAIAWKREPKNYVFQGCAYLQVFEGERFVGNAITPLIELPHNTKEEYNELKNS